MNYHEAINTELEKALFVDHTFLAEATNPVTKVIEGFADEQLEEIILQYAVFPRSIVNVLVKAAYTFGYYGWNEITSELRRNVFEELGGGGGKIGSGFGPHYSLLRREVESVFGVDTNRTLPSRSTSIFLGDLERLVQSDPNIVAGVVHALEASAVPELAIVKSIFMNFARRQSTELSQTLIDFFDFHLNIIEVGHRDRLSKLIAGRINSDTLGRQDYLHGINATLLAMEGWWKALAMNQSGESNSQRIEPPNVSEVTTYFRDSFA